MNIETHRGSTAFFKSLESDFRTYLPKNKYAVIRVDGKGFSKYTKHLNKPFDSQFTEDMRLTAQYMCENIDGAIMGYTQSDEISIIITDRQSEKAEWWFGGEVQKLTSIAAGHATGKFNSLRVLGSTLAVFDGRVHILENLSEVGMYLKWRQDDAIRNSVSMLASHHFSSKSLMGIGVQARKERLTQNGTPWEDLPLEVQQGSLVKQERSIEEITYTHGRTGEVKSVIAERKRWVVNPAPRFS